MWTPGAARRRWFGWAVWFLWSPSKWRSDSSHSVTCGLWISWFTCFWELKRWWNDQHPPTNLVLKYFRKTSCFISFVLHGSILPFGPLLNSFSLRSMRFWRRYVTTQGRRTWRNSSKPTAWGTTKTVGSLMQKTTSGSFFGGFYNLRFYLELCEKKLMIWKDPFCLFQFDLNRNKTSI